jgi:hypothetical protein
LDSNSSTDEPATAAEARRQFFEEQPDCAEEIRDDERNRREREADNDNHRPDRVVRVRYRINMSPRIPARRGGVVRVARAKTAQRRTQDN